MSEEPEKTGDNRNDKGQFTPGQSGNPKGRPLGSLSVTDQIKKELAKYITTKEGDKKTYLELLTKRIVRKAVIDGSVPMIKSIWAYTDGFPKQNLELDIPNVVTEVKISIVKTKEDIKNNEQGNNTINDSVSEELQPIPEEGKEGSN